MKNDYLCGILLSAFLLFTSASYSQSYFQKTVNLNDEYSAGNEIQPTADGNYIICGTGSWVEDSSFVQYTGASLIKITPSGDTLWTMIYGDSLNNFEEARSVKQTFDGGYITIGNYSVNGTVLRKMNATGNEVWRKTYSCTGFHDDVVQASDSGYVFTDTYDGLIKTDKNGNWQWQKTYGVWNYNSVSPAANHGFIITTLDYDTSHKIPVVIKTDSLGVAQWTNRYGGNEGESRYAEQTSDGGYIITGLASLTPGDSSHVLLIKIDASGAIQWQKIYYTSGSDEGSEAHQAADGGYIVTGLTDRQNYEYKLFLLKTDAGGNMQWAKKYGETYNRPSVKQAADGGFICSGYYTVYPHTGTYIVKTDALGNTGCAESAVAFQQGNYNLSVTVQTYTGNYNDFVIADVPGKEHGGGELWDICINPEVGLHHFWVTAGYGGPLGNGTILKSDSLGRIFVRVAYFHYSEGVYPAGELVMGGNGRLYGVCQHGGFGNSCTLFSMDTSTFLITKHHDFALNYADGDIPFGGLMAADDCKFYGTTVAGGADSSGVLYSFDPATNTYTKLFDFTDSTGTDPIGELTQLSDGKLYGTCERNGPDSGGVIYSFDPVTHAYEILFPFGTNTGYAPWHCKLIQAPDGNLYGCTAYGGSASGGVLFRFNPVSKAYDMLHDFNYYSGGSPFGKVAYVNGKIYGTTRAYTGQYGMIFSYDLATNTFNVEMLFNGANGANPWRGLNVSSYGTLYGVTPEGGANNQGVVFSYDPVTHIYSKHLDFENSTTGRGPDMDVFEAGSVPSNPCLILSAMHRDEDGLFELYPNPTTGEFNIRNTKCRIEKVDIYNLLGERVYSREVNSRQIAFNCPLPAGIYLVKVTAENGVGVKRVVKD
jgi:uncharacterized repeat protein (TIGR03803 family)